MTDKVKELAEGLSEAQARVIRQAKYCDYFLEWIIRPSRRRSFFERMGLSRRAWDGFDEYYDRLTDLGLAVRQYLKDNQDG